MYVTQPLLPQLARDFDVRAAVAGATVSAVVLTTALSSAFYGPLSEIFGRRRIMVGGSAVLSLATAACGFAPTVSALIVLRALQGALVPCVSALAVAYVYEDLQVRDAAAVVGGYVASSVVGGLVSRVGGGAIADVWGWRGSFVVFAAFTLVGTLALAAFAAGGSPRRRSAPIASDLGKTYAEMLAHVRDVRLVGAFLIGGALFFGFIGIFTYLPFYMTAKPFALSTTAVSWLYASYVVGATVSPIAGRLAARIPARVLIAAGIAIAIAGITLSLVPQVIAVALSAIVLCAGMFVAQPIVPTYVGATAASAKGSAIALYQSFYYLGAVFGSLLPGFAWERWAWPGVVASCLAALVLALLADWQLCKPRTATMSG